ncbi:hypothetical protein EGW08_018222 [Elysia chlorotica]|uniref:SUEL-type lectin domain-containing protein n=1 Tax=Elysia chlorotica TaxID=188477 RepID=A0A3S1AWH9_ELYCH|nr:hypothetical protein EGW08_018222 [Elysia chlorotica]
MAFLQTSGYLCLAFVVFMQIGESQQANKCRSCSTIEMESTGELFREKVPGAAMVKSMELKKLNSAHGTCVKDSTFGYLGPDAYVDQGCSGEFEICYVEGRTETISCGSTDGTEVVCDFDQDCDVRSIALHRAPSEAPCIEGFSYQASKTAVTVRRHCEATFIVGCRACVLK